MSSKSSEIPFCLSLNIILSCQTLSKALDVSKKALLTLNSSSKDKEISWVFDRSWLIREAPGLKPDWLGAGDC